MGQPVPTLCLQRPLLLMPVRFTPLLFALFGGLLPIGSPPSAHSDDQIDFAREVLPILSDKCFVCHGPDAGEGSDLRLDAAEFAMADRGGYRAVDPHDPASSELLVRILSADDPMPPADAEKQLTAEERAVLQRWILAGGQYALHWAFVPPRKEHALDDPVKAIDHYIGAKLDEAGIPFAPPAKPHVLARRAALVLTGLPLEPQQLDQFLADSAHGGYERLVDRLMASPQFGEHQARYWLDAVRYGDTHGLHLDNRRGIYPYRDWVVRALNQNLPFDQFIRWQLAGDLYPQPSLQQLVATGYVRMNPSTGEGGAIADEFQMKNNFDRVETLGTVFLGMSLNCARCHTHKYDPIEQREYYQLLAFFNSTAEPALDGNSYTYGPVARAPDSQSDWDRWEQLAGDARAFVTELELRQRDFESAIEFARRRMEWQVSEWKVQGPLPAEPGQPPAVELLEGWADAKGLPGTLDKGLTEQHWPGSGQVTWVTARLDLPCEMTLDVRSNGAPGSRLLADGEEAGVRLLTSSDESSRPEFLRWQVTLPAGEHRLQLSLSGRERGTETDRLQVQIEDPWQPLAEAQAWAVLDWRQRLSILADPSGPLANEASPSAADMDERLRRLEEQFTTSLIARELPQPRETRLLRRGEYDLPVGDPLLPDVPAVMNPWPADAPRNRLGLAQWLTDPAHPLVARVLVNRFWQQVMGHPLSRTPEDFGVQGRQPTHPELLDWLAVDFIESGWDYQRLIRALVTSRTFCQDSAWRGDVDDPENRLYARGASYRLDAEVVRDVGLWASGLLDPTMGGAGVKPYQPAGMWQALAHPASNTKLYQPDSGSRLYRRSLYVYWKRTSPHPMMTLFDAPDRESSCVRRSRTNTPLQSLAILNETQRMEMASKFAERLIGSGEDDQQRIDQLFRLLAHRDATERERAACTTLVAQAKTRYEQAPEDAAALLAIGEAERDRSLDPLEHAAWTQLAATVLASDLAILLY